ncbi:hypothetical protein PCANC_24699 [Puccinia coronata f. sp. avenae]|uniref:Uncharacterized protein n=1 Tax=Puccinia coronata f. sp. avenae TaxID=200324 RepID=A0A2N5TYD9_9BASI|nr:hypothetical protein PCANC_24699 [Puccinia coronata f. sp. avenae]
MAPCEVSPGRLSSHPSGVLIRKKMPSRPHPSRPSRWHTNSTSRQYKSTGPAPSLQEWAAQPHPCIVARHRFTGAPNASHPPPAAPVIAHLGKLLPSQFICSAP